MYCELNPVIEVLIEHYESVYKTSPKKAEDGLNRMIDSFDGYIEVIRLLNEH